MSPRSDPVMYGHPVVEVWDTGIGIAPENCTDIFKEFHQLGNPNMTAAKA